MKPIFHIQHKSYLFLKHYKTGNKTYWRCKQLFGDGNRCSARLVTTDGRTAVIERGRHDHVPHEPFKHS